MSNPFVSMNTALLALAWKSWTEGGTPVLVEPASGRKQLEPALQANILFEEAGSIRFADAATLVQAAAKFVIQNEGTTFTSSGQACFGRLHELWLQDKIDEPSLPGQILASLHNSHQIDAYEWACQAVTAGIRPYDVLQPLEEAIPLFIHANAASIVQFFSADYGNDRNVFGGSIYPKLEPWLEHFPTVARDITSSHEEHPTDKGEALYGCALQALMHVDFLAGWSVALNATAHTNPLIAGPGLHVLGLVDYADAAKTEAANDVVRICTQILRSPEHVLTGTAVGVLGRLVNFNGETVVPLLDDAGRTGKATQADVRKAASAITKTRNLVIGSPHRRAGVSTPESSTQGLWRP